MVLEHMLVGKSALANVTLIGLFSGMFPHVDFEGGFLDEGPRADFTLVRFFSGVNHDVTFKMVAASECATTFHALVGASSVGGHDQ